MYLCENCGTFFDKPIQKVFYDQSVDCSAKFYEQLCPVCMLPYFSDADYCPKCNGYKFTEEILCKTCRADLLKRFNKFADNLTAEEEQQLDEWTDGVSITERKKWS